MTLIIPVMGTFSWVDIPLRRAAPTLEWWQPGSSLLRYVKTFFGMDHAFPAHPFQWCAELPGANRRVWQDAGDKFGLWVKAHGIPATDVNVIAHSYGGEAILYAAAQGCEIRNLITFATPVMPDLHDVATIAKTRIGHWMSVVDPRDIIQLAASGGRWDAPLTYPQSDATDTVSDIGHSSVLYDSAKYHLFKDRGWDRWLMQ